MANVTFSIASWFKKNLNPSTGVETSRTPMLFRSLSNLIFRPTGQTVEDAIAALEEGGGGAGTVVYATEAAYDTAYAGGQIPEGTIGIITGE